jgi:hypothetical protein
MILGLWIKNDFKSYILIYYLMYYSPVPYILIYYLVYYSPVPKYLLCLIFYINFNYLLY